jgi:hypothetical protein
MLESNKFYILCLTIQFDIYINVNIGMDRDSGAGDVPDGIPILDDEPSQKRVLLRVCVCDTCYGVMMMCSSMMVDWIRICRNCLFFMKLVLLVGSFRRLPFRRRMMSFCLVGRSSTVSKFGSRGGYKSNVCGWRTTRSIATKKLSDPNIILLVYGMNESGSIQCVFSCCRHLAPP